MTNDLEKLRDAARDYYKPDWGDGVVDELESIRERLSRIESTTPEGAATGNGAEVLGVPGATSSSPGGGGSIFGTPPELIPEGAEEFVSDAFRALRFTDRDGDPCEVRVVNPTFCQSHEVKPGYVWEDMLGVESWEGDEFTAPAHPWLSHWLDNFTPLDTDTPEPDEQRGLYGKYIVRRVDGSSEPGGKHEHCEYFVLDLAHDAYAAPALRAYAESCRERYPGLARDLLAKLPPTPEPEPSGTERSAVHLLREWQRRACDVFRGTTLSLYDGTTWRASLMWWTVPGQRVAERYCRSADPLVAVRNAIAQTPFRVDTPEPEPAGDALDSVDQARLEEIRTTVSRMQTRLDDGFMTAENSACRLSLAMSLDLLRFLDAVILDGARHAKELEAANAAAGKLKRKLYDAREYLKRRYDLLHAIEWHQQGNNSSPSCPCCEHQEHMGHAEGCELHHELTSPDWGIEATPSEELEAAQQRVAELEARFSEYDFEDSDRLSSLRGVIDDAGIWESDEAENEGDYEECVRLAAERIAELETKNSILKGRAETAEARVRELETVEEWPLPDGFLNGVDNFLRYYDSKEKNESWLRSIAMTMRGQRARAANLLRDIESARDTAIRERDEARADVERITKRAEMHDAQAETWVAAHRGFARMIEHALKNHPPLPNPLTGPVWRDAPDQLAEAGWYWASDEDDGREDWWVFYYEAGDVVACDRIAGPIHVTEPVEPTEETES